MSEKRRPTLTIVARKLGKRPMRVELYPGHLWPDKFGVGEKRYRVRVNRKWSEGDKVFTLTEVMRQLRGRLAKRM